MFKVSSLFTNSIEFFVMFLLFFNARIPVESAKTVNDAAKNDKIVFKHPLFSLNSKSFSMISSLLRLSGFFSSQIAHNLLFSNSKSSVL